MTDGKQSAQILNLLHADANKLYYEIDGQINNLYNMHSRAGASNPQARDMSNGDVELVRERISLLKDKTEALTQKFGRAEIAASLTAEKQTYWRERIEHLNRNC